MIEEGKLTKLYTYDPINSAYLTERKCAEYSEGYLDIFKTVNNLGIRVALADYGKDEEGNPIECCQFIPRSNGKRGYIVLSNNSSIEKIRYNCALMLYCAIKSPDKITTYSASKNNKSINSASRVFASYLLMREKELKEFIYSKDETGKYLYLNENNKITLDNLNYVSTRFGVPFIECAIRVFESFNNIEGIRSPNQLMKEIRSRSYVKKVDKKYESILYSQLIDSLRYLKAESTKIVTLEKILRECVKNEALLEGVIKDTKSVNYILQVFAKGGKIDEEGNLVNSETGKKILLSEEQLLILGNYQLLKDIAYQGAAYYSDDPDVVIDESIGKAGYGLASAKDKEVMHDIGNKYLNDDLSYREGKSLLIDACNMKEYEAQMFLDNLLGFEQYTLKRWHKTLFNYSKDQEHIKGKFRTTKVIVSGASFDTAEAEQVNGFIEALNYDVIDLLRSKDELSNYEYINKVNMIVARFIMIHPFEDGNGRVSRALMNFLYKKKHMPFVFINADNQRGPYIEALKDINFIDIKKRDPNADVTKLNLVASKAITATYSNIYDASKMLINPERELSRNRLKKPRR